MHSETLRAGRRFPGQRRHARYINFISDYMAANRSAPRAEVLKAWQRLKRMDAPKTYESWARRRSRKA
jgi:hypothetical protein